MFKLIYLCKGILSSIAESIFIPLFLIIDAKIYSLISTVYGLFMKLAKAQIFTNELYQSISNKVYAIVGVIALFILAYSLLQALINPDNISKGDNSGASIVKRLIISLVLIALVPTIFDFLYSFQDSVLSYGSIQKFFFKDNTSEVSNNEVYFQDENGNYAFEEGCEAQTYEEALLSCEKAKVKFEDGNHFELYGNELAYTVLNAFLHPANGKLGQDVDTNASDYFNVDTGLTIGGIACAFGAVGLTAITITSVVATGGTGLALVAPIVKASAAALGVGCIAGFGAGLGTNSVLEAITYDKYKWSDAEYEIVNLGDFNRIVPFENKIDNGEMEYTFIISTVCGAMLLYMLVSFCLDLGLRAAKLAFYEMMAPVCLLLSIAPNNKGVLNNWVKATLTTYGEIFVRIFCMCSLTFIFSQINDTINAELGGIATAIIAMGLVMFAKQLPKLLGEVTGIKSEGMKLGIVEKLRDGGALTAGAAIGGGLLAGANNLTNAGKKIRNKWKEDNEKGESLSTKLKHFGGGAISGIGSVVAGTTSGFFRGGKAGIGAKKIGDTKSAALSASSASVINREKRAAYKAQHKDVNLEDLKELQTKLKEAKIEYKNDSEGYENYSKELINQFAKDHPGVMMSHVKDAFIKAGDLVGISNTDAIKKAKETVEVIKSKKSKLRKEAEELIIKEIGKSSSSFSVGEYLASELRNLALNVEATKGTDAYAAAKTAYDSYLDGFGKAVQNEALKIEENYNALPTSLRAKLGDVRSAAEEYRNELKRNVAQDYVRASGITMAYLNGDMSLKTGNETDTPLDNIGDQLDLKLQEYNSHLARIAEEKRKSSGESS
ncbi:MAG: hypothetical protein E7163_04490 [Firmicutes bacterium]|nr:hypothetical protein [Bacillota bacterium]